MLLVLLSVLGLMKERMGEEEGVVLGKRQQRDGPGDEGFKLQEYDHTQITCNIGYVLLEIKCLPRQAIR